MRSFMVCLFAGSVAILAMGAVASLGWIGLGGGCVALASGNLCRADG